MTPKPILLLAASFFFLFVFALLLHIRALALLKGEMVQFFMNLQILCLHIFYSPNGCSTRLTVVKSVSLHTAISEIPTGCSSGIL